jgi:hypothetical protein
MVLSEDVPSATIATANVDTEISRVNLDTARLQDWGHSIFSGAPKNWSSFGELFIALIMP